MTSTARRGLAWALILLATGCAPTVGTQCDLVAAQAIAYDEQGSPAYVGQSMMITSCALGGSYCHAPAPLNRYGAPFDMDLFPVLADSFTGTRDQGEAHLLAVRTRIFDLRDDVYGQVVGGQMPPRGIGNQLVDSALTTGNDYRTYGNDPDDLVGTVVPDVRTPEGHAILRNWLACNAPMIEGLAAVTSTPCTRDGDCPITGSCSTADMVCRTVGETTPMRDIAIDPTCDSIYTVALQHNCATSGCHDATGAPFSGHLDMSTSDLGYAALVGHAADASACGTRVVAGNPNGSFLIAKLEGTQSHGTCGDDMPLGEAHLTGQIVDTIRMWIMNGALQH